jgi:NhaA family Na+:H+ antiporter
MAVFFFIVGLEVKREIVLGELRDVRKAALPVAAAIGGMLFPAGIYLLLEGGGPAAHGWGIPMATDIAFVVGCMAVLGSRLPSGLRVLLLSLAIADDIGAILVIAIAYTESIDYQALAMGVLGIGVIAGLSRLGVRRIPVYVVLGGLVWLGFHESGIHATIAGVILGLMTPTDVYVSEKGFATVLQRAQQVFEGDEWSDHDNRTDRVRRFQWLSRETLSPVEFLEHSLHPWSSFLIVPIFALANAGVQFQLPDFAAPAAIAVTAGLVIGKPLGIFVLSLIAVKLGVASLPSGVTWPILIAGAMLAGIGFTMSIFIAGLALNGPVRDMAMVGVLAGSVLAAIVGMVALLAILPKAAEKVSS